MPKSAQERREKGKRGTYLDARHAPHLERPHQLPKRLRAHSHVPLPEPLSAITDDAIERVVSEQDAHEAAARRGGGVEESGGESEGGGRAGGSAGCCP